MCESWLPALLLFEDDHGDWPRYVERIHQQFLQDFVHSKPSWPNKEVRLKRHPEHDGKSATFWHMISEGENEQERTPDLRRCERIAWPKPMMNELQDLTEQSTQQRVVWWCETRKGEVRYTVALEDFSYIVIVADRGNYVLPWTAFALTYEHEKRKKRNAWKRYWDGQKS
jgi:FAD/FMN-containing dehydrogenase